MELQAEVVGVADLEGDGNAESGTEALGAGAGCQLAGLGAKWNTAGLVADGDLHFVVVLFNRQPHRSAGRRGLDGVVEQAVQRLLHQIPVSIDGRLLVPLAMGAMQTALDDMCPQQSLDRRHQLTGTQGLPMRLKRVQIRNQGCYPAAEPVDSVDNRSADVAQLSRTLRAIQQLCIGADRRERIADVVGNDRDQAALRCLPLLIEQCVLALFQFGSHAIDALGELAHFGHALLRQQPLAPTLTDGARAGQYGLHRRHEAARQPPP